MIDTHAHLDFPEYDQDREEVIRRAFDSGVKKIINIGVDLERSDKSIEIAEGHENIFASTGLHPDFFNTDEMAGGERANTFAKLKELARSKKIVAIGETGLDYFSHTETPINSKQKENQKKGFLAQIEIAKELKLPVIVHCRDAWQDLYDIVSRDEFRATQFVLHCYSGDREDTEKFLELPNAFFSFSGNITYPKPTERASKLEDAVRRIPLSRMMLDSDSPYLAPQAVRGKRNEPLNVRYIAQYIADIKGISVEEAERSTDGTAAEFFRLGSL